MQPPDIVTQKLHNLWVTIYGYCAASGYHNPEVAQPSGYNIRKFSNQAKGKLLWFVSKSLTNNKHSQFPGILTRRLCKLQVTMPRGCATSGYHNPKVAQSPGYNTWKLCNLQVVTWKLLQKNLFFRISPGKQNIFQKYFGGYSKAKNLDFSGSPLKGQGHEIWFG